MTGREYICLVAVVAAAVLLVLGGVAIADYMKGQQSIACAEAGGRWASDDTCLR